MNANEPTAIEATFPEFTVLRLPDASFDDLLYVAAPLDLKTLHHWLSEQLAAWSPDPIAARARLDRIVQLKPTLTGFSRRAMNHLSLIAQTARLPFELETASPRSVTEPDQFLMVAIEPDPGLSREEAELLQRFPNAVLVLTDGGTVQIEKLNSTLNVITNWMEQTRAQFPILTEPVDQIPPLIQAWRQQQLLNWIETLDAVPELDSIIQSSKNS